MSGDEIIQLLEKRSEMTEEEMAVELDISITAIFNSLRRLLGAADSEVDRRKLTKEEVEKKGKKFTGRHYIYFIKNER